MLNRRSFIQKNIATGLAILTSSLFTNKAIARRGHYGIVGSRAPELDTTRWLDRNGNSTHFSLKENEGKWVFLKCFQSWCPGCHKHGLPTVKKVSDALSDNPNVVFAGIQTVFEGYGVNSIDKAREIQVQYKLNFPVSHDAGVNNSGSNTMRDYRTGGTPWMILINPERTVVFNDFGLDADKAITFLTTETKGMKPV